MVYLHSGAQEVTSFSILLHDSIKCGEINIFLIPNSHRTPSLSPAIPRISIYKKRHPVNMGINSKVSESRFQIGMHHESKREKKKKIYILGGDP